MPYIFLALWITGLILLSACQTPPSEPRSKEGPESEPILSAQEYLSRGIGYLEEGAADKARQDLKKAIAAEPNGRTARKANNLLSQIDIDPVQQLGRQSFKYRVRRGDTFSEIAQKFLGDPLKFYILARYNDIEKPRYLDAGQVIKIPGKRPEMITEPEGITDQEISITEDTPDDVEVTSTTEGTSEVSSSDKAYQKAKELFESGQYQEAIDTLSIISPEQRSQDLRVEIYIALADDLYANNNLSQAIAALEQAYQINPTNKIIVQKIETINKQITLSEAERLYNQGQTELEQDDLEAAYEYFRKSLMKKPDYSLAQQAMNDTKIKLIEKHHQQAVTYYIENDYCKAIEYWNEVLKLDSNHASAADGQAKAKKILNNLNQECP